MEYRGNRSHPCDEKNVCCENGRDDNEEGYNASHFGMRVGEDYQAAIPNLILKPEESIHKYFDRDVCLWHTPITCHLSSQQVEEYLNCARSVYGYSTEQALGVLAFDQHDLIKAAKDLRNFMPSPENESIWSAKDKALFERAFELNGKDFVRIRQMLPQKSVRALVEYYYLSKNKMGRKCRKKKKNLRNLINDKTPKLSNNRSTCLLKSGIFIGNSGSRKDSVPEPKSKKKMNHSLKSATEYISLRVVNKDKRVIQFKMKKHFPLENLMNAYCDQEKLALAETYFTFDSQPINNRDTPFSLHMKDNDIIEVGSVQMCFVPSIKQNIFTKKIKRIELNVLGPDNLIVSFRINKHHPLRNLMKRYCRQADLPVAKAHFRFDGVTIYEHDTPLSLEMNEGDTINVYKDSRNWISMRSLKSWNNSILNSCT